MKLQEATALIRHHLGEQDFEPGVQFIERRPTIFFHRSVADSPFVGECVTIVYEHSDQSVFAVRVYDSYDTYAYRHEGTQYYREYPSVHDVIRLALTVESNRRERYADMPFELTVKLRPTGDLTATEATFDLYFPGTLAVDNEMQCGRLAASDPTALAMAVGILTGVVPAGVVLDWLQERSPEIGNSIAALRRDTEQHLQHRRRNSRGGITIPGIGDYTAAEEVVFEERLEYIGVAYRPGEVRALLVLDRVGVSLSCRTLLAAKVMLRRTRFHDITADDVLCAARVIGRRHNSPDVTEVTEEDLDEERFYFGPGRDQP